MQKQIEVTFKIFTLLSFIVGLSFFSTKPAGGDEIMFINHLDKLFAQGWYAVVAQKSCPTLLFLCYPFRFIFNSFITLRIVNVLLFIGLLMYYFKYFRVTNKLFYYYFLFYSSTCWFLLATNDVLFIVSLTLFFSEVYYTLLHKTNTRPNLMLSSLIIAITTREMVVIYLPVIVFSLYLVHNYIFSKDKSVLSFWKSFALLLVVLLLHLPSLQQNHTLSYDDKQAPKNGLSNWYQRQYLAQLLVNKGKLENHQHPSWEETDAYLKQYGLNSLPKSTFEGLFFDVKLTIKEFFKDFLDVSIQSIRQTGLIVLIVMSLSLYIFKNRRIKQYYIPIILAVMVAVFSLIIISYVETRWLVSVFIVAILYYAEFKNENKVYNNLVTFNMLFTILIAFYGMYKMLFIN